MSISVTCDSCCAEFQLRDAAAGKKVRCKSCGDVIQVPKETLDDLDDFDKSEEDEFGESSQPRLREEKSKKKSGKSKRSSRRAGSSAGFFARQWEEAPVRTTFLFIYLLSVLIGCCVPIWLWYQAACYIGIGLLLLFGGIIIRICLQIWYNPWILITIWAPIFWVRRLSEDEARHSDDLFKYGLIIGALSILPMCLFGMFGVPGVGLPQNQPVANFQANPNPNTVNIPIAQPPIAPVAAVPADGPRDPFKVAEIPIPEFEIPKTRLVTPNSQIPYFEVRAKPANGGKHPGSAMRLRVYLPRNDALPRSLGCVLVGPAGSNMISGKPLDSLDHEEETVPYVQAGMAVVHFSLDGPIEDLERANEFTLSAAYKDFSAAGAGIVNARNAMAFAIQHLPEVDRNRIYIAGHSSAGSLALLFAEHEPTIRGCIAFAPACELRPELGQLGTDPQVAPFFAGIQSFVIRSAPITHVGRLGCPVFLFHGQGDTVVPIHQSINFVNSAKGLGKSVTFSQVPDADHYTAMVQKGVPQAVQWLKTQFGEPGSGASAPDPQAVAGANPQPPVATNPGLPGSPAPMSPPAFTPQPRPANPNRGVPRKPSPGDRVVTLKFSGFKGSGNALSAAQDALKGLPGVDASVLIVDEQQGKVIVLSTGGSLNSGVLAESLRKSGFDMSPGVSIGPWKP